MATESSPAAVHYLSYPEAVMLHIMLMRRLGETHFGVFDRTLVESALARPRHAATFEGADLIRQAATLCFGLIKNHEAIEHLPTGATLRIPHVSWEDYEQLLADLGDGYHVRVSYDGGWLEIMSPLPEHEEFADVVLGITREITRALGVKLETRGSMTIRSAWQAKGAEPDTCFYVQNAMRIIGKRSLDCTTDPPPDIVVEIDVTNASQHKFPIYAALGVSEIWRYDGSQAYFYSLSGEQYIETAHSRTFPFLPSAVLAQSIAQSKTVGQDAALDTTRAWVRVNKTAGNG